MEGSLRQMPSHRSDRLAVPFAQAQAKVELADVSVWTPGVIDGHRLGSFGKRPLQITIHIGPGASVAHIPRPPAS